LRRVLLDILLFWVDGQEGVEFFESIRVDDFEQFVQERKIRRDQEK
jgi:hypothetical protein